MAKPLRVCAQVEGQSFVGQPEGGGNWCSQVLLMGVTFVVANTDRAFGQTCFDERAGQEARIAPAAEGDEYRATDCGRALTQLLCQGMSHLIRAPTGVGVGPGPGRGLDDGSTMPHGESRVRR